MDHELPIYGAGMAGLLAANMLRRHNPMVYEAQDDLPDNHGALLRFRSEAVSSATGQTFKKVRVEKEVASSRGSISDNNAYSFKVTGNVMSRSVLNLEPGERFIAPDNFIAEMARNVPIRYGTPLAQGDVQAWDQSLGRDEFLGAKISTIPMPVMMKLVGWEEVPNFSFLEIWSVRVRINFPETDVYQTIYFPHGEVGCYRASITGNLLIMEYAHPPGANEVGAVLRQFGFSRAAQTGEPEINHQKYGKLVPVEERIRKRFIMYLTDRYNVYSVGRFATWRQILMDDVVKDLNLISKWISTPHCQYSRSLHWR